MKKTNRLQNYYVTYATIIGLKLPNVNNIKYDIIFRQEIMNVDYLKYIYVIGEENEEVNDIIILTCWLYSRREK
ncbi:hypothetical protein RJG79_02285 [Mycoplasmatota bacterium WC44]